MLTLDNTSDDDFKKKIDYKTVVSGCVAWILSGLTNKISSFKSGKFEMIGLNMENKPMTLSWADELDTGLSWQRMHSFATSKARYGLELLCSQCR